MSASRPGERGRAHGEGLIVTYDYRKLAKAPIPEEIRRAIEAFEAS